MTSEGAANQFEMWLSPQGAANQFEMWLGQSLFVLVLYKGKTTKLGLRTGLQMTFNKWPTFCCPLKRLHWTTAIYRDIWNCTAVKSVPTLFRSIFTDYFLYKYIFWSHMFISLLSSMFSSTLLIGCTISVVPVQWLSSSVYPTCWYMLHGILMLILN